MAEPRSAWLGRSSSWAGRVGSILAALLIGTGLGLARADDWAFWRGPGQMGCAAENAVVTTWSPGGEHVLWRSDIGGRTTPIIMDGRVFYLAPGGEGLGRQERAVCLDADTGKLLWEHRFNVFHTDIVENRIGWTAMSGDAETGYVYAHGTGGELFCFDRDGRVVWKHSMTEEFGRISGYGGRLHNPIVDEDRVIVSFLNSSWGPQGKATHRYLALDKRTGKPLWWSAPGGKPLDTTYACPVVTVIDGRRLLIAPAADGNVYAMLARTGERVWTFRLSKRGLNVSPVVDGKYVYVGHSEENLDNTAMGRVVCIDASGTGDITESGEVWRYDGLPVGYASPALRDGRLYVVTNNANLFALDAKTGKEFWRYKIGRVGKGSPTVTVDGVIYVGGQTGLFHILKDAGEKCVELNQHRFDGPGDEVDEIYGSPAVVDGRVYFMTRYGSYCLGDREAEVVRVALPAMAEETPVDSDHPVRLMISPAEVTLRPGEAVQFHLRVYDENGGRIDLKDLPSTESPGGAVNKVDGTLDEATGGFTAAATQAYSAGTVTAKWRELEAAARVRVIPELPIEIGFDDWPVGSVPPGWVGVGKRVAVADLDGENVLQKVTTKARPSPPFMRLRGYATMPISGGYTVQADMMSRVRETSRLSYQPDMGLINSRYRFIMLGADKKRGKTNRLRIESWSPMPRLQKDVAFNWDPDVWYTVKFRVERAGDQAVCRAKVWPRGQKEPSDWTIEINDPYPNTEGSAGLYCYSTGTTSNNDGPATYFDNFKVMRND